MVDRRGGGPCRVVDDGRPCRTERQPPGQQLDRQREPTGLSDELGDPFGRRRARLAERIEQLDEQPSGITADVRAGFVSRARRERLESPDRRGRRRSTRGDEQPCTIGLGRETFDENRHPVQMLDSVEHEQYPSPCERTARLVDRIGTGHGVGVERSEDRPRQPGLRLDRFGIDPHHVARECASDGARQRALSDTTWPDDRAPPVLLQALRNRCHLGLATDQRHACNHRTDIT